MAKRKSLNRQNQEMTLKPAKISGLFKVTSSIVIPSSTLRAWRRNIPNTTDFFDVILYLCSCVPDRDL